VLADREAGELAATARMLDVIRSVYELYGFEALETPAIDDAFRAQQGETPTAVRIKRRNAVSARTAAQPTRNHQATTAIV